MDCRARVVSDPAAAEALSHPLRREILQALRTPDSAAGVARTLGQPRQKVNYHVKELARAGLVRPVGEQVKGHLTAKLYEAVAGTFVVSPRVGWDQDKFQNVLRDQVSLRRLLGVGEQLQRDVSGLLDRAEFDGEEIPSASVEAEICFPDDQSRTAFMEEYLAAVGPLLTRYGARRGREFRLVLAVYPNPEDDS